MGTRESARSASIFWFMCRLTKPGGLKSSSSSQRAANHSLSRAVSASVAPGAAAEKYVVSPKAHSPEVR